MHRLFYYLLIMAGCGCLTACDPFNSSDHALTTYQQRLQNVLALPEMDGADSLPAAWPSKRDRRLNPEPLDINLLQFLSLYGCDLQVVVGEKNAILGRVMQPLNELRYSLRFIDAAERCKHRIDTPDLQQTLAEAVEQKKAQLPVIIWQASWGSEEFAGLFNQSGPYLRKKNGMAELTALVNDLAYLSQTTETVLRSPKDMALFRWGKIQQRLQYQQPIGSLLKSAHVITQQLSVINLQLKKRLQQKPICYQQNPSALGRQLHAMFQSLYIKNIQPYLSLVSRQRDMILPALAQFSTVQRVSKPEAVKTYYQQYLSADSIFWKNFDQSVKQHTRLWQKMLDQCGLRPAVE